MMSGKADNISDFMLNHLRREDMRPKEDFKILDLVRVTGGHITGRIMAFDPDMRLAQVDTTIGIGWWYLKDLEKIYETTKHTKGTKKDQKQAYFLFDIARNDALRSSCISYLKEACNA